MRKINPSLRLKINSDFSNEKPPKKSLQKLSKNLEKNSYKNSAKQNNQDIKIYNPINSRTMEWLKIPDKTKLEFRKNLININIDYLQYTCYNIKEPLKLIYNILWFDWTIDSDNSNIEYNYKNTLSLLRNQTKMWYAYTVIFLSPWFAPIPVINIEVYNEDKEKFLKTQGKIVFYWAYFVFEEILKDEAPEVIRFYNFIKNEAKDKNFKNTIFVKNQDNQKPIYKVTRVDIALDINQKISQQWLTKYIQPHKNSKHTVKPYNWQTLENSYWLYKGFQSFSYIPKISQGINIRIYNKILDIQAKNKTSWYPEYWLNKKYKDVTRIELIYWWDSARDTLDNLINYSKHRILWDMQTQLNRPTKPKSEYSPLSAYEYFKRYAKNHGKTLREVLNDVTTICITEEEKDKYDEINEKYNNINNSNYWDIEICSN